MIAISAVKTGEYFQFRGGKKLYKFNRFVLVSDFFKRGEVTYFDNDKVRVRKIHPFTKVYVHADEESFKKSIIKPKAGTS